MCRIFKVSRSAFYAWLNRKPSKRALENNVLRASILELHHQTKSRLRSPKLTMELRNRGLYVSRPRVAWLMKKIGIRSIVNKKFKVLTTDTDHEHPISENLLKRDFSASRPGNKWVSGITYVRTRQWWLFLTIIMDLFDRKNIGWYMIPTLAARTTVIAAFQMAVKSRPVHPSELIFHSEWGVQNACDAFRKLIKALKIFQSKSRKGDCWDNAVAE